MDQIHIQQLRFEACHGVLPDEHETPQPFIFDITLELDLEPAAKSDELEQTVNYADVAATVERIVNGEHCRLIEHLADRVIAGIFKNFTTVEMISLTVYKPKAPMPQQFDNVAVSLTRFREDYESL